MGERGEVDSSACREKTFPPLTKRATASVKIMGKIPRLGGLGKWRGARSSTAKAKAGECKFNGLRSQKENATSKR